MIQRIDYWNDFTVRIWLDEKCGEHIAQFELFESFESYDPDGKATRAYNRNISFD